MRVFSQPAIPSKTALTLDWRSSNKFRNIHSATAIKALAAEWLFVSNPVCKKCRRIQKCIPLCDLPCFDTPFSTDFMPQISWENEYLRAVKPLILLGFSDCSLLYPMGTPQRPWCCKTERTFAPCPPCWVTTTRASPCGPIPTLPRSNRRKRRSRWGRCWRGSCERGQPLRHCKQNWQIDKD